MPAFTVSSVDTTANTLTSTGVAASGGAEGSVLQTGDRLRLRNTGGALPAATPSLAGATDYWAVRISDNSIQLSDTNAHALAGTNIIDLTTTGSGTTTIEFGLPYCLPTAIAGPGVQARSSIFNAMYSSLVALYDHRTEVSTLSIPINAPVAASSVAGESVTITGGTNGWKVHVALPVGATVVAFRARVKDSATGPTTLRAEFYDSADGSANAAAGSPFLSNTSSGSGAEQTIVGGPISVVVTSLRTYHIVVLPVSGVASCSIHAIEVDIARRYIPS